MISSTHVNFLVVSFGLKRVWNIRCSEVLMCLIKRESFVSFTFISIGEKFSLTPMSSEKVDASIAGVCFLTLLVLAFISIGIDENAARETIDDRINIFLRQMRSDIIL